MVSMVLKIGKSQFEEIRRHGEQTYPHECCGVLLGRINGEGVKQVRAVVRCGNTRIDSPHNRYHIDPRELIGIQRQAREAAMDILGFYHSHPDHPAGWSETDLAEAHWIDCSYVITSVEQGRAARTNSFELAGEEASKQFHEEEITVESSSPSAAESIARSK